MSTLVPYRRTEILDVVSAWWVSTYPDGKAEFPSTSLPDGWSERNPLTVLHLYQSYCEFTLAKQHFDKRLDLSQFAKCLVACAITDIGSGSWRHLPNWVPKDYELRRANGDYLVEDLLYFYNRLDVLERVRPYDGQ